jgi:hypothetical protein
MLANTLSISNDDPHVYEMKVIPTIEGFIYVETIIMHTGREVFRCKDQESRLDAKTYIVL